MAAADFDLDGDVDVLLGVRDGQSRLLANSGLGEFVDTATGSMVGEQPLAIRDWESATNAVVAHDFDDDGDVDVFACNDGSQLSQLFVNLDASTFQDTFADAVGPDGDACVAAGPVDINGDGWTDIALIGRDDASATPYHLRVLLNRIEAGQRWFAFADDLEPTGVVEGEAVGAIGVEGEGVTGSFTLTTEQAASGAGSGRTSYEFGGVTGTLWFGLAPPSVGEVPQAISLELMGDGSGHQLGIYVLDAEVEAYTTDLGTLSGTGWESYRVTDPGSWTPSGGDADGVFDAPAITVGIVVTAAGSTTKGDLFLDDVVLEAGGGRSYLVEGFERPVYEHAWADDVSSIASADVDGDGDLDLVLSSMESADGRYLKLLTNRSDPDAGSATASLEVYLTESDTPSLPDMPDPVAHVTGLDVDDDGDPDLLSIADGGQDRLLINDGSGHFFDDSFAAMPVDWSDGRAAAIADLDLDGRIDAVIANWGAVNRLYLNDGEGGFDDATPDMPLYDRHTSHVLLFDADGDQDLDVFEVNGEGESPGLFVSVEPDSLD